MMDLVAYTPRRPKSGETLRGDSFSIALGGKGFNQAIAAGPSGLRIPGTKHHTTDPSMHQRRSAHDARLEGDVQRRLVESIVTDALRRIAQRDDLRVGRRIVTVDGSIGTFANDLTPADEHGADGNLAAIGGLSRQTQRVAHEIGVGRHRHARIRH